MSPRYSERIAEISQRGTQQPTNWHTTIGRTLQMHVIRAAMGLLGAMWRGLAKLLSRLSLCTGSGYRSAATVNIKERPLTEDTEYGSASFSRSSSLSAARSPDTASHIYPDRSIRPLPKSRLKSKLSPEQQAAIVYPPDPPPISPTLSFSVQDNGSQTQQRRLTNGDSHHHDHDRRIVHDHCTCGDDPDSGDDEVEFDHPDYRYPPPVPAALANGKPVDSLQRRLIDATRAASNQPPPPGSTASSADGYESFENTSNKKKRKIPLSGASSMHQSSLSAEMANMGISSSHGDDGSVNGAAGSPEERPYSPQSAPAATPSSGTGISGAGRGRYGRDGRHRRPLGSNTMNAINGYSSRAPARGADAKNGADAGVENTGGIISQAIKTAAEQGPLTPAGKGRDNVSLLQSAASQNSTTPKTQFTFTCESDSATKMVDQQLAPPASYGTPTPARNAPPPSKSAHGTQTSNASRGQQPPSNVARPPPPPANAAPPAGQQQQPAPPPKPKPRRNPAKEYALQAAQRKRNQQYQNYHHRPKPEDMWVCEFCEYEDIYGAPPYAMIRRYEIKDRQERKKAAEKRRLLEKAKMKGRKNKKGAGKGGKNNNGNNSTAPPPPANAQNYDPNLPPPDGEEYYDDEEYDGDDYDPVGDEQYDPAYYPPPAPGPERPPARVPPPGARGAPHPHV